MSKTNSCKKPSLIRQPFHLFRLCFFSTNSLLRGKNISMAASPKVASSLDDWIVVPPRRGKHKRGNHLPPKMGTTIEHQPWAPTDFDTDPKRESQLMQKMEKCITRLENSECYNTFLDKIKTPEVLNNFSRILISETKMQMVIYGIGSIESYETARLQLALAILLKRSFDWIGDIEVFDPVLSKTESKVLEALGCSVLLINEQARRMVLKPTLFFMPHCEAVLYDNLLQANWCVENLNQMVLFGNSFECYEQQLSMFKNSSIIDSAKFLLLIRRFSVEVGIDIVSDDFFRAFHDSSLHFFQLDAQQEGQLQALKL